MKSDYKNGDKIVSKVQFTGQFTKGKVYRVKKQHSNMMGIYLDVEADDSGRENLIFIDDIEPFGSTKDRIDAKSMNFTGSGETRCYHVWKTIPGFNPHTSYTNCEKCGIDKEKEYEEKELEVSESDVELLEEFTDMMNGNWGGF